MSTKTHPSSCFHSGATANHHHSTAAPPPSGGPNLTTTLYHTEFGLFALTWSRTLFGRSLHLHHLSSSGDSLSPPSLSTPSFSLHLKPFFFNKSGSKILTLNLKPASIFWDLSKAKFGSGSGPEPHSGFFIAVTVAGEIALLVGDSPNQAYSKTRAKKIDKITQSMVLRREHVYGNKFYTTKSNFGGKSRDISIDCRIGSSDDPRLCFSIDNNRVLEIKHLKWKFRGNERIEFEGIEIQISWDVCNWLFEDHEDGYALFMFRFEKLGFDSNLDGGYLWNSYGFGFEAKKMKKKGILRSARSSSAASSSAVALSSASSSCSSVMEWASAEENELKGPSGFSLMVYAWKNRN